jgi:hypothetical protein
MQFSYRNNNYETERNLLEVTETNIAGKYRGHHWKYKLPRHIPQLQPKVYLQYRGVAYSTCPMVKVPPHTPECASVRQMKKTSKSAVTSTEKIHLENLRRNLEHRLKSAQVNGNEDLITMLQKECKQLQLELETV